MATRKNPGGGKKPPRKPVTSVVKPKAKVTKSRGSNTKEQVGNQNQREYVNQQSAAAKAGNKYMMYGKEKISKADVNWRTRTKTGAISDYSWSGYDNGKAVKGFTSLGDKEVAALRAKQRAGGSANLGYQETKKQQKVIESKLKSMDKKPKSSTSKAMPKPPKPRTKKPVIATKRSQGTRGR